MMITIIEYVNFGYFSGMVHTLFVKTGSTYSIKNNNM
jgi:hypothetical protein